MRGISEERLKEISANSNPDVRLVVNVLLQRECKELNPWLPIEDAPWNRPLLTYYPTMPEGLRIRTISNRVNWDSSLHKPTHYQKLPDDPEE